MYNHGAVTRLTFILLCGALSALGQSTTAVFDGTTPAALAPGNPPSAYPLSAFEHFSPFTGKVNPVIPLHHVGGRGTVGTDLLLTFPNQWTVRKQFGQGPQPPPNSVTVAFINWMPYETGYGPGLMFGRRSSDFQSCSGTSKPVSTLTLLTFIASDGTETELRDVLNDGADNIIGNPCTQTNGFGSFNRGTQFASRDGSAMVFTSATAITDGVPSAGNPFIVTGTLQLRDGTTYNIASSHVTWMRDRNGNKITFTYDVQNRVTTIVDQLNRTTTVTYDDTTCAAATTCDHITYQGTGGTSKAVEVGFNSLGNALRSGFSLQTTGQLFPIGLNNSSTFNPTVVSYVRYPNSAQFQFLYNSYGEFARIVLPTGGAVEYDIAGAPIGGALPCGFVGTVSGPNTVFLSRVATARREYSNGTTLSGSASYSYTYASSPSTQVTNVTYFDGNGVQVNQTGHNYLGQANDTSTFSGTNYNSWQAGKESMTQWGSPVLKTQNNTFQQAGPVSWCNPGCGNAPLGPPDNNPRLTTVTTTLNDTSQVSEVDYGYDAYNNVTSKQEKDYGSGAAGSLIRQTTTTYLTAAGYISPGVNLVSLPILEVITNGSTTVAQTEWCYDNGQGVAGACNSSGLQDDSGIVSHDSGFGTSYTTRGNVTAISRWLSTTNTFLPATNTYDIAGNILTATDRNGNTTTFSYADAFTTTTTLPSGGATFASVTKVTLPSSTGFSYSQKYDYYLGKPTQFTDINGIITNITYESAANLLDRPMTVDRAVGVTADETQTNYAYCDSSCNPSQTVTTFNDQVNVGDKLLQSVTVYDGLGRVAETRQYEDSSHYISVQTGYDSLDRVTKVSNPTRSVNLPPTQWTTTLYDGLSRVKSVTAPDGSVTNVAYSGNQTTTTDPSASAKASTTDALGRVTLIVEDPTGLNYQTKYTYDALGNLKQVCQNFTSACGETRTYQYDSLSRLTSAANPESKNLSTTYAYDSNGNLVTKTDANGVITCYGNLSGSTCTSSSVGYDSLNRLLKKSYSDTGTSTVSYTYDSVSKGRLSSVANGVSTTSYTAYDSLGRVKASSQSTDGQTYAFSGYTYNRAGALTSVTYPSARVVNTSYDGADRVSLVSSGTTNYATLTTAPSQGIYAYTPHGAIQQMSLANGVVAVATPYSADRLQPQSVTATVGSTTPLLLGFYYCPNKGSSCTTNNGNLITQTMAALRQDYGYDKANRLTSAAESGGSSEWSQTYGFDAYGNRWVSANSGYTLSTFTPTTPSFYDTFNRLNLTVGSAYDNAGNQTQQGGYTQAYDAENRVKSSTIGGATTTYSYDGAGRRVMKVSGGVTTVYVYDVQGQLAAEYATAVANSPCRTCYLTGDHLGSTRLVTDGSGNTVSLHDYLPWGEEIPAGVGGRGTIYGAPDSVRHKFTGKERDAETGLDYFGARYFSGPQGRFTSPDKPFADQHPENPQTWNLYMYGRNNPVRFLDDTGQASIDYLRRVAVRMAWEQERALVQRTGQGTRDWSAAELEILKNGGTPSGYQGHHINSVKGSPELAGDPNNIQFATPEEHLQDLHGGDTRVPTFGDLISRSLGVLSIVQVFTSQLGAVRETQVTGVTESMSPFSFGNTYIVDPAKAAVTLNGAYIQVNGENGGLYQVQNGNYTRVGCTDKPDQCTVDPNKLKGSQFEIVDPRKMM